MTLARSQLQPEAGGHAQAWAECRWLPHSRGSLVAQSCPPDPVFQPHRGKWNLHKAALPPERDFSAFPPHPVPRTMPPQQANCASHAPVTPDPVVGGQSPPLLLPGLCSHTRAHASGIRAFFHLGTKFFQR